MKSEFVALASHELRTPLTSIYGFSDLLRDAEPLSSEQRQWASFIHAEAERLTSIVERLLNVSRIEAGSLVLAQDLVPAQDVVESAFRAAVPVDQRHRVAMPSIPMVNVRGDRGALIQVLSNLIDNALKYSGGSDVEVSVHECGASELAFAVRDRGPGIPDDELPRLFDRFHRVARPEFDRIRSTGLGLYIVKELVERMGGTIDVETKQGVGSTFRVTVPTDADARALAA